MKIPFLSLSQQNDLIKDRALQVIKEILHKDWYILGQEVAQFEEEYAAFNQTSFSIGVGNGLDALRIALMSLGVKAGDEVIVPSNTFIATWLAVSDVGAKIIPVEPNKRTYNLSSDLIEKAITPRTKAIIPVHLYGQACEMNKIMSIAKKYNLFVIEDNAQAQGATSNGQLTGSFGEINATSFYPGKNLGAMGDAGAITTHNKQLNDKAKELRNYGSSEKYIHNSLGFNSRLDEFQAAILRLKLHYLSDWNAERLKLADCYNKGLKEVGDIILPYVAENSTHVYHLYVIRTKRRDELRIDLEKKGITTLIHYPIPPYLQEAYKHLKYKKGSFPIAEEIAETCLSLPLYPGLSEEQVNYISKTIRDFFEQ